MFRDLHKYHISEITGKMVELLKREGGDKDKEAGDLIFTKLNNQGRESNREMLKGGPYEPISAKWLFGMLNLHMGKSKRIVLEIARSEISKLYVTAPKELLGGVRNPEGMRGWLSGKNEL